MPSRVPKRIVEAPKGPDNETTAAAPELGTPDRLAAPFTRHPRLLVVAQELPEQACVRFVLSRLLSFADKDGVCWETVEQLAKGPRSNKVRQYSYKHVCRSLNRLRDIGLLAWDHVPPFGYWPHRIEKGLPGAGTVQYAEGPFTRQGGRIWRLNLAKLRMARSLYVGSFNNQARYLDDGSSMIHPSRSPSPSEKGLNDPARSSRAPRLAPTALDDEPQTRPGSRVAPARAQTPPPAPVRGRYASAGGKASETPSGSFAAAHAVPQDPRAPATGSRARAQGEEEHEARRPTLAEWLDTLPPAERARMHASLPPKVAEAMGLGPPEAPPLAPPHKAPPHRRR